MKRTHPAFWGFGWAGLFVGSLLTVLGMVGGSEAAQLAGGYGLMMAGAAVYLLGGLGLRRAIARRSRVTRPSLPAMAATSVAPATTQTQS
jgi:hypothetical protein